LWPDLPFADDGYFGEEVAVTYDDQGDPANRPEAIQPVVNVLAELARSGRVLEFAIGTGRIALPVAARGVEVHGIELSRAMVAQLRAKPGGETIPVSIGDMATTRVEGQFQLVYLVFNTIMNLTTLDGQAACFANAAAHLEPGGCFLIETMVPALRRLPPGDRYVLWNASDSHWGIDEYDVERQGLVSHHFQRQRDGTWTKSEGPFRYVWPAELDVMASAAGLRLRDRWADWLRAPFTSDSASHVSVWEKPA
jgi:SAM-dependent methyltransferase